MLAQCLAECVRCCRSRPVGILPLRFTGQLHHSRFQAAVLSTFALETSRARGHTRAVLSGCRSWCRCAGGPLLGRNKNDEHLPFQRPPLLFYQTQRPRSRLWLSPDSLFLKLTLRGLAIDFSQHGCANDETRSNGWWVNDFIEDRTRHRLWTRCHFGEYTIHLDQFTRAYISMLPGHHFFKVFRKMAIQTNFHNFAGIVKKQASSCIEL